MKKKFATVIALIFSVLLVLTGCSGGYTKIKITDKQDYSYVVTSNGGSSVMYGNYVYFANGTRGYADDDAKGNIFGKVIKGGVYRAELNGTRTDNNFAPATIATSKNGLEFKYTDGLDYDGNSVEIVNNTLIVPKVIGTTGYKDGGIFIYDEWIYYASPNNERDKTGTVQVTKTDYYRTKLDGSATHKLYTTVSESSTTPYVFTKFGDSVYMVCQDGTNVISVKTKGNKKPEKPVTIAANVKGVLLPYKTTYDKANQSVVLEDYVYVLRNVTEEEPMKTGTAIEVLSPDGKEGVTAVRLASTDMTLEAVRDNTLFYRARNDSNNMAMYYNNLHETMMENSSSYKAYQGDLPNEHDNKVNTNISGDIFATADMSTYTSIYCMRPMLNSNVAYAIAVNASATMLFSKGTNGVSIINEAANISFVANDYLYFTSGEGKVLMRAMWDKTAEQNTKETVSHLDMTDNGLKPDYIAGYIVYFGKVDQWADGYAYFKKVDSREGASAVYIGTKIEGDIKPDEDETEEDTSTDGSGEDSAV